jgi:hypothetical protein
MWQVRPLNRYERGGTISSFVSSQFQPTTLPFLVSSALFRVRGRWRYCIPLLVSVRFPFIVLVSCSHPVASLSPEPYDLTTAASAGLLKNNTEAPDEWASDARDVRSRAIRSLFPPIEPVAPVSFPTFI